MIDIFVNWLINNKIEAIASILGLLNIYLGIKEKALFWIIATVTAVMFFYVFLTSKLYAYMLLQIYYFSISIYGFYYWTKGTTNKKKIPITHIDKKNLATSIGAYIVIYILLTVLLTKFTDSNVPYIDAFVTTSSLFGAFFIMKKFIESWFIWIFSDIIAILLLFYKELYAATILQIFYFIFAIIGYFEWKKSMQKQNELHQN